MRGALAWTLPMLFAVPATAGHARAVSQITRAVPDTWLRYADLLQYQLSTWIETSDDPAAGRLRAILASPGAVDPGGLVVHVWVDPDGKITRVTTEPRPTPTVAQDLSSFLVGKLLDEAPPAGIRWPASLALMAKPQAR